MKVWNLINDPSPLEGSLNMAIDDYLFQSLAKKPETYVRFYQWKRPTVSLGYSQRVENVVNLDFCRMHNVDLVRRITGGKLVLHHREITYSIVSADKDTFTTTLAKSYRLISEALIVGLKKMGLEARLAKTPPLAYVKDNLPCFSHPARDEVEVGGLKIIGSAQKRAGAKFLQHGSIPLEGEESLLRSVSLSGKECEMRATSLSHELRRTVDPGWAVGNLVEGIGQFFRVGFVEKIFSDEERAEILGIQKGRYENEAWTGRPSPGSRVDFS